MDIIDALLGEHGVFYAQFDEIDRLLPHARSAEDVRQLARVVGGALLGHARIENTTLFDRLKHSVGADGPVGLMYAEHDAIDRALATAAHVNDLSLARRALGDAISAARSHFEKEEQLVFPMGREVIGAKELEEMAFRWAERRTVAFARAPSPRRG